MLGGSEITEHYRFLEVVELKPVDRVETIHVEPFCRQQPKELPL
jgi:hypothetical protein